MTAERVQALNHRCENHFAYVGKMVGCGERSQWGVNDLVSTHGASCRIASTGAPREDTP